MRRRKLGVAWRALACLAALVAASPLEAARFHRGDVNGDGCLGLADAVEIFDALFQGGGFTNCCAAADVNGDASITLSDGIALLDFLYLGGPPPGEHPDCSETQPGDELALCGAVCDDSPVPCEPDISSACRGTPDGRLSLRIEAARTAIGAPGEALDLPARVVLDVGDPGPEVHGWSLGLRISDRSTCEFSSATVLGTVAATTGEGGLRDAGFEKTEITIAPGGRSLGVVTSVLLGTVQPVTLPVGANEILALTLSDHAPDAGCVTCALEFRDDESGSGEAVPILALELSGDSLRPRTRPHEIEIHAANPLTPGVESSVALRPDGTLSTPRRLFRFPTSAGQVLRITASASDPDAEIALRVRCGSPPSASEWDLAAVERGLSRQSLVLPYAPDGECFALVLGHSLSPAGVDLTVLVETPSLVIERISTSLASTPSALPLTLRVHGGGFDPSTRFTVESFLAGDPVPVLRSEIIGSSLAQLEVDTGEVTPGLYDLVATRGEVSARLRSALRVLPRRLGPRLETEIVMAGRYRRETTRRLVVRVTNRGDEPARAPLLRLAADDAGDLVSFRLDGDDNVSAGSIELLATSPGSAQIAPGVAAEIPVEFTAHDPGEDGRVRFRVDRLDPSRTERVCWRGSEPGCDEALPTPSGPSEAAWIGMREELALALGERWTDVADALAVLAEDVARRGENPASSLAALRLAARRALGRPTGVARGVLRDEAGRALASVPIAALSDDDAIACATTNGLGEFTLDGLPGGVSLTLAAEGHAITLPSFTLAPDGALSLLDVLATVDESASLPPCASIDGSDLPTGTLLAALPAAAREALLATEAERDVAILFSVDPNEKDGTSGQGGGVIIPPEESIRYQIQFENEADAGAAAYRVLVEDFLPPELLAASVQFEDAGFGGRSFPLGSRASSSFLGGSILPSSTAGYGGFAVEKLDETHFVAVEAEVELLTGRMHWEFRTVDKNGTIVDDLDAGFLPPNPEGSQIGTGFVSFTVSTNAKLVEPGDLVTNDARITFDYCVDGSCVLPLDTSNQILPELDFTALPPRNPRPRHTATAVRLGTLLAWERRRPGETYDVYLWADGDAVPVTPTAAALPLASYRPPAGLPAGTLHRWRVVTRDRGREAAGPEWSFRTELENGLFVRGDVDTDGSIGISDAVRLLGFLFLGDDTPACLAATDANADERTDIADAVSILGYLFLGGVTPASPSPRSATYVRDFGREDCGLDPDRLENVDCESFPPCR